MFLNSEREVIGRKRMEQREAANIIKWVWVPCAPYITTTQKCTFTGKSFPNLADHQNLLGTF